MNKTKKGLLIAGSIISIIEACLMIVVGIFVFSAIGVMDFDLIKETLIDEGIGYTDSDINEILEFGKTAGIIFGIMLIAQAIAIGVISIRLLNKTKKNIYSKGLNITLLVFSILIGEMLVMAFMIAGLVIRDQTPTLDNIKEIGEQHNISGDIPAEKIEETVEEIKEDKE